MNVARICVILFIVFETFFQIFVCVWDQLDSRHISHNCLCWSRSFAFCDDAVFIFYERQIIFCVPYHFIHTRTKITKKITNEPGNPKEI